MPLIRTPPELRIRLSEHEIAVEDNGSGMDLEGLKQYFNIGSSAKRREPKSPRFGRDRIGEFGIGKFSTLSASDHFEVSTQKGDFAATVIFDRKEWEATREHWYLPLRLESPDPARGDGTRVILRDLKKTFDLEGPALTRISGEVNADFLPITSDRSGFVRDALEFIAFEEVMSHVIDRARKELSHLSDEKENRRVRRALKEVMEKIQQALAANTEWCPPGLLPVGEPGGPSPASISEERPISEAESLETSGPATAPKAPRKKRPRLKSLTPSAMIKKLKVGQMGLALVLDHFGPDRPESFTEGDIIYINRDHPLYLREARHRDRQIMHVARLIGQEIALMSKPRHAREAFERQSKLLRDAFISSSKS